MASERDGDLFAHLLGFERTLSYRSQPCAANIRCVDGDLPVLLSAAHSCAHRRSGIMKMEEEFTAAMVWWLAQELGCSAIYLCGASDEDPNFQPQARYKDTLRALALRRRVRFVIDSHGMINRHGMGVALGTMHDRACSGSRVQRPFLHAGFKATDESELAQGKSACWRRVVLNHRRFTGGIRSHTVTRFVREQLGIPAVQIELASICRVIYSAPSDGWPHAYAGLPRAIAASLHGLRTLVLDAAHGRIV